MTEWTVTIYTGADITPAESAPTHGIPTLYASDGTRSETLAYGPVYLRTVDNALWMETYDPHPDPLLRNLEVVARRHRKMMSPHFQWDHSDLRVTGFEVREDGALVQATWGIEPYEEDAEEKDAAARLRVAQADIRRAHEGVEPHPDATAEELWKSDSVILNHVLIPLATAKRIGPERSGVHFANGQ